VIVFRFCLETEYTRARTLLSWVALWALGFVRVSVRVRSWGCGSGSSLTAVNNCHECQIGKKVRNKYGELPERLAERPIYWNIVDVDLIGPLTIKTPSGKKELLTLRMIDPSTGWFEVKDLKDKSAKESMNTFDDVWLSRYPKPEYIGFDNGG
jgi:hypothetical protein